MLQRAFLRLDITYTHRICAAWRFGVHRRRHRRRTGASETAKVRALHLRLTAVFFRAAGMIRKVTERLEELSLRLVVVRLACQVKLYLPRRHAVAARSLLFRTTIYAKNRFDPRR